MYVVFEGVDTTGKSTQVGFFQERHSEVRTTKEPGGTSLGVKLRDILLNSDENLACNTELLLFLADRAEHYEKVVKEARKDNILISDRGFISGIAYALANHPNLNEELLIRMNAFALNEALPEKIVLFMTNATLIEDRLGNKKRDTIEKRGIEYLLHVQDLMLHITKKLGISVLQVDAKSAKEEIYRQIEEFIYD